MVYDSYAARLDIDYPEKLDRLTNFFRFIWAIPILIILPLISPPSTHVRFTTSHVARPTAAPQTRNLRPLSLGHGGLTASFATRGSRVQILSAPLISPCTS